MIRPTRSDFSTTALAAASFLLGPTAAFSSDRSIRCGTNLIYAGGGKDSAMMYEVLKKCGDLVSRTGNTWIYVQGSMTRVLTFNFEGRLNTIESRRN